MNDNSPILEYESKPQRLRGTSWLSIIYVVITAVLVATAIVLWNLFPKVTSSTVRAPHLRRMLNLGYVTGLWTIVGFALYLSLRSRTDRILVAIAAIIAFLSAAFCILTM